MRLRGPLLLRRSGGPRLQARAAAVALLLGAGIWLAVSGSDTLAPTPGPSAAPSTPAPDPSATPMSGPSATRTPAARPAPAVSRVPCGDESARLVQFRIQTDEAIPAGDTDSFGATVRQILCDSRSWIASDRVRFAYHPNGSLLIGLRTPDEAQRRCLAIVGLSVERRYSCGTPREIVINHDRWAGAVEAWLAAGATRETYRQMLVNHEVGHALGLRHRVCEQQGAPAPVMMQQSKGLTSSGRTCSPNPWPRDDEIARL